MEMSHFGKLLHHCQDSLLRLADLSQSPQRCMTRGDREQEEDEEVRAAIYLFLVQIWHDAPYSTTGHQNLEEMMNTVLFTPGWQRKREAWSQWMTSTPFSPCLTRSSISQLTAPRTQVLGRIPEIGFFRNWVWTTCRVWYSWNWVSGQVELEAGLKKKRAHLACQELSRSSDCRYSRFLWSVHTRNGCSAPSSQCLYSSRATFTARLSCANITVLFHLRQFLWEESTGVKSTVLQISVITPTSDMFT